MNDGIGHLLDRAANGIEPRVADPMPRIHQRHRRHVRRVRATVVSALVLAVLATIGAVQFALEPRPRPQPVGPAPIASPAPTSAAFLVADGVVRANGVTLPIPAGWSLLRDAQRSFCDVPTRTLSVNGNYDPGPCDNHDFVDVFSLSAGSYYNGSLGAPNEVPFVESVLPGGEPIWLDAWDVNLLLAGTPPGQFAVRHAYLPWSAVIVTFGTTAADMDAILRSLRSAPVEAARLALPSSVRGVFTSAHSYLDQQRAQRLLALLAGLDRAVQPGELPCPGAAALLGGLRGVPDEKLTVLAFVGTPGASISAVVALHETPGCAYATSSMGGRVWLPDGFMDQAREVIGDGR